MGAKTLTRRFFRRPLRVGHSQMKSLEKFIFLLDGGHCSPRFTPGTEAKAMLSIMLKLSNLLQNEISVVFPFSDSLGREMVMAIFDFFEDLNNAIAKTGSPFLFSWKYNKDGSVTIWLGMSPRTEKMEFSLQTLQTA